MKDKGEAITGDAVRVWHILDRFIPALQDARCGLHGAGCEVFVELLERVLEEAREVHAEAEQEVNEDIDGGSGRSA